MVNAAILEYCSSQYFTQNFKDLVPHMIHIQTQSSLQFWVEVNLRILHTSTVMVASSAKTASEKLFEWTYVFSHC